MPLPLCGPKFAFIPSSSDHVRRDTSSALVSPVRPDSEEGSEGDSEGGSDGVSFEQLPEGVSFEQLPEAISFEEVPEGVSFEQLPEGVSFEQLPEGSFASAESLSVGCVL